MVVILTYEICDVAASLAILAVLVCSRKAGDQELFQRGGVQHPLLGLPSAITEFLDTVPLEKPVAAINTTPTQIIVVSFFRFEIAFHAAFLAGAFRRRGGCAACIGRGDLRTHSTT